MNIIKFTLQSILLLAGPVLWADSPSVIPPPAVDPLAEALPILQGNYPDFGSLHYQKGDRLTDLVARSNGKIDLVPPPITPPVPIITAALPNGIVYWRLGSFTPRKNWDDLASDLRGMIDYWHVVGAILDLRSNATPNDYAGAAHVAALFVPGDDSLWKYVPQKGNGVLQIPGGIPDRTFEGPLIVLTDAHTSGAAEMLAASLKNDGAVIIGSSTAGTASYFEDVPLSSGHVLRFAVAPTDVAHIGRPITPDIAVPMDDHSEKAALTLIRDNHILDVIEESTERHRLNEATLVKGQDPELDAYLVSLERKPVLLSLPAVHDPVLISAIDSLRAIRLSERTLPAETVANTPTSAPTSSLQ